MTARTILLAHPSPDLYGSDRVLLETVTAHAEQGWRVVVALPAEGPLTQELLARGAEPVTVPTPVLRKSYLNATGLLRLAWQSLRSLPAAIRLVRQTRPSLVLVNTVTIPLWVLVGRLSGRPVVWHVHEAEKSAAPVLKKLL